MEETLKVLVAVTPCLALLYFFYRLDRFRPEPTLAVLRAMLVGALCVIPALGLQKMVYAVPDSPGELGLWAFLVVAFSEETCKLIGVFLVVYRGQELVEPYDGIVYCVAVSTGFALVENLYFVWLAGLEIGILRALLAVPCHALFGVAMGFFLGRARFASPRAELSLTLWALLSAVTMHGLYNFVLVQPELNLMVGVLPLVGVFWLVGLHQAERSGLFSPFRYLGHPHLCDTDRSQRRRFLRLRTSTPARLEIEGEEVAVTVRDLGLGGALVESPSALPEGVHRLTLLLAEGSLQLDFQPLLDSRRKEGGVHLQGGPFVDLTQSARRRLIGHLLSMLADRGNPDGEPE